MNPPDHLCVLIGEQGPPLTLQAADELARWGNMRKSQRRNRGLVDDEQHENHYSGPGEGHFSACIGAVCSDAQSLGTAQEDPGDHRENNCGGGGNRGDGQ